MRCIHGQREQYERGYVDVKITSCKGRLRTGLTPKLDGQMIVGRDWPPLYEVLEEVWMEDLRHGRWPRGEGWIAEEDSDLSNKEERVSLETSAEDMHFRTAQEKDSELQRIQETEVAWVEEETI
ncbi:hypothetical protein Y1Q_0021621 [Alligator mississippiensis]|uniref:Uncharacterized protein n=1 Tax=Alligator mississippiensis TaxID=8496 RepID=A0A151PAU8_ALLMI|nr:hypothetical protein Y1Q_0021621 [Alligator mississippiensis]